MNDILLLLPMVYFLNVMVFAPIGTSIPNAFLLRSEPASLSKSIILGLGVFLLHILLLGVLLLVLGATGNLDNCSAPGSEAVAKALRQTRAPSDLIISLIESGFAAPLLEEMFFRGFIFNCLRQKVPFFAAAFVSGLMWACVHQCSLWLVMFYLLEGLLIAFLYEKSGRFSAPLTFHSLWNVFLGCLNVFFYHSAN